MCLLGIASMWNGHYSQLFNCVKGDTHKSDVLDAINLISGECDMFNHNDVKSAVASLFENKACGMDSLSAEHLLYASPEIHNLLAICFNAFIIHDSRVAKPMQNIDEPGNRVHTKCFERFWYFEVC